MISSSTQQTNGGADAYTDLSSLNAIRDLGREDKNQALEKIATQFESMMIRMMMKSMREANDVFAEDSYFSSNAGDMYEQMYDDQLALSLSQGNGSQGKGLGIAEVMIRQLQDRFGTEKVSDTAIKDDFSSYLNNRINSTSKEASFDVVESQALSTEKIQTVGDEKQQNGNGDSIEFDGKPETFISQLYGMAKSAAEKLGVTPDVLIAQAALETGWGKKVTKLGSHNSFNLFNIKADSRWQGSSVSVPTIEIRNGTAVKEVASFRAYQSPKDSFDDYVDFISNSPRYTGAMQASSNTEYIKSIDNAGYATDPAYSEKVIRILNSDSFQQAILQNQSASL